MALSRAQALDKRHRRVRTKVRGTSQRPRLCVHKTLKHLYAQVIDDTAGRTLCFITTNTKAIKADAGERKGFANMAMAKQLGTQLADAARGKGVEAVVFDRGGYRYHGVVKAFADAARQGGLKF